MSYWAAIGGAALNILGGVTQYQQGQHNVQQNQRFVASQRGTAYRTAVADMRAAGLNPILAAGGGGAVTPSAPSGSVAQDAISPAVTSALAARRLSKDLELADAEIENKQASTELDRVLASRALAEEQFISLNSAKARLELPKRELFSELWRKVDSAKTSVGSEFSEASDRFFRNFPSLRKYFGRMESSASKK